jgi:F-type H+-transporting ATPase subunit delta
VATAARRYARAAFELAQEAGDIDSWQARLEMLRDLLTDERVAAVLTNPTIPAERRMTLISDAPHQLDPAATNLARLLIESGRVGEIGMVLLEFERLADESAGRVVATVTSAIPLEQPERQALADRLSKRLGRDVRLDALVDPRILGGLKLQYGDHLVDASVAARLQQLRRRLAAS